MYYIKLSTSYLTRRVKVVGRGKKTFVDDKVLDQNVRSTFRAVAATWRLSILGRTPPGKLNVTWWSWNLKKNLMSAFWKTKGNMFAFIKKEKKIKLKKYMGRIYYSPWNDTFFLVCGRRFRDNREGDFRRSPDLPGTLPHGPSWTLEILETFVLGPS